MDAVGVEATSEELPTADLHYGADRATASSDGLWSETEHNKNRFRPLDRKDFTMKLLFFLPLDSYSENR